MITFNYSLVLITRISAHREGGGNPAELEKKEPRIWSCMHHTTSVL